MAHAKKNNSLEVRAKGKLRNSLSWSLKLAQVEQVELV